jgi:hypothetical protein
MNPRETVRGGKLDAAKRQEYQAEVVDPQSWETAGWPRWTVTGRVLPERCDINLSPIQSHSMSASGRSSLDLRVTRSLIAVACVIEHAEASVLEVADIVRSALAFPVDYIAFVNRGAYETVLDLCLNHRTGEAVPIPIGEPTFDDDLTGLCFNPAADKSNILIPLAAGGVPEFATALHDLTDAARYPRRTFERCWMAIEVVRRHFDPVAVKDQKKRHILGRTEMCKVLAVSREALVSLERVAARSRHGELIFAIDWQKRKRALELTTEVVARFERHLGGASREARRPLTDRIET